MRNCFVLIFIAGVLAGGLLAASRYQGRFISKHQAEEAVRAFEGNNTLQFRDIRFNEYTEGDEWEHHYRYELRNAAYLKLNSLWEVDAITGEVTRAYHGNNISNDLAIKPFGPMSKEQCRVIGERYARAKFRDFDKMGFRQEMQQWRGTGWLFKWERVIAYGAITYDDIGVEVNPKDGSIQNYFSFRVPPTYPKKPKVSAKDALSIAIKSCDIGKLKWHGQPSLLVSPDGDATWILQLRGITSQGNNLKYAINIDAETGKIHGKVLLTHIHHMPYRRKGVKTFKKPTSKRVR